MSNIIQPVIHRQTAFVLAAAAVVQGLSSVRNPQSKREMDEIVAMAHYAAERLLDGQSTEG